MKTILVLSFLLSTSCYAAVDLPLTPGSGAVAFEAVGHPSALKIHGTTNNLDGKLSATPKAVVGKFLIDLTTLDTGIKTRNEHMKKKYLEVEKYPKSQLTISHVGALKEGSTLAQGSYDFDGELELHGVKKPIRGKVDLVEVVPGKVRFEAAFQLNMKDFNVQTPSYAGITVADQVQVNVKGAAVVPSGKTTL